MTDFLYIIYDAANIPTCGNKETEIYGPQWGYSVEGMSANNLAGPIFMKKQLVIDECNWILDDEAKKDPRLNPTDKNILAVMQWMFDYKQPLKDGFYTIVLRDAPNVDYTLQKTLGEFGFVVSETTISRTVNKLCRFGYIDYKKGFWNNNTHSGQWPKIKILKGTHALTDCTTDNCSVIARGQKEQTDGMNDENLSTGISDSCSVIARAQNTVQVKEKEIVTYSYSDLQLKCESDFNVTDLGRGEDTTCLDEVIVSPDGETTHTKTELEHTIDQMEWCIDNGVWASDISFDLAFDTIKRKVEGLDLNYDYLRGLFDRKQKEKEQQRMTRICANE